MFVFCKKCKKEIANGSIFCSWCGKKQSSTKRKIRKRVHGSGTIRIDKRLKNKYLAYAPSTSNGQGRKYLGSFSTYAEADTTIKNYTNEIHPVLYNYSLSEIYESWSNAHFPTLSDSGVQGYQAAYKSISELWSIKMRLLKTADFQRCVDICAEQGASRSKLEKIRQICSQLCKYAMQNDLMDKNYAEFIKLPKKEKRDKQIFTDEDLNILWDNADDKTVQAILIMIYTGFRIGELTALKCSDVNFENHYMIGGEKTEAGRDRIVPFPSGISEIEGFVQQWVNDCETETNTLLNVTSDYFRKYMFYPCLAKLGLIDPPIKSKATGKDLYKNPRLTPHCTRHTFATLSANAGMKPENLQKIIGHASYETTADIYIHKNIEVLSADMAKLRKHSNPCKTQPITQPIDKF